MHLLILTVFPKKLLKRTDQKNFHLPVSFTETKT